jgi:hypothetical protein
MRLGLLVCALLLLQPTVGWAEWQLKPFLGVTFGGTSTYLDLDVVAEERKKLALGASVTWLGNFIGVEGEVARVPGYFQTASQQSVLSSSVTTLTGSVVVTLPRKLTQYALRPYFVAGGGVLRVNIEQELDIFNVQKPLGVLDFGGGATGFLTDRIGLNWDVRYFRSVGGEEGTGLTVGGKEQVSFWRATMGVAIRLGASRGATP